MCLIHSTHYYTQYKCQQRLRVYLNAHCCSQSRDTFKPHLRIPTPKNWNPRRLSLVLGNGTGPWVSMHCSTLKSGTTAAAARRQSAQSLYTLADKIKMMQWMNTHTAGRMATAWAGKRRTAYTFTQTNLCQIKHLIPMGLYYYSLLHFWKMSFFYEPSCES